MDNTTLHFKQSLTRATDKQNHIYYLMWVWNHAFLLQLPRQERTQPCLPGEGRGQESDKRVHHRAAEEELIELRTLSN
jgi:hypothetical protein